MTPGPCRSDSHEGVNGVRHLRRSQPIIAMAPLLLQSNQFSVDQLGKVPARRLRRNPGMTRKLASRQSMAAHQGRQDVGAGRIPYESGNARDGVP